MRSFTTLPTDSDDMTKRILISTALSGFLKVFLEKDVLILQSMGYEVHFASNNTIDAEKYAPYFEKMGIIFHQVDFSSNKPFSRNTLHCYRQFSDILTSERFDAVHIHTPIPGVIGRLAANRFRRRGMKVLYTTHGFYFHKKSSLKTKLLYKPVEYIMSAMTDAVITINLEDYEAAKKMFCKRVYHIPGMGVDINRFRETVIDRKKYRESIGVPENAFMILSVGELTRRKNHRVVIEALRECDIPGVVFVICGEALTDDDTKQQLIELALENNVDLRLLGHRNDIPELCKCSDIGVLPSLREGLGLAGIEMLASGMPIVASGIHGIVDYVEDGYNGFLADPLNSKDFADKIKKLHDPEVRNRLSLNCYASTEPFNIEKAKESIQKIYSEVLT